LIVTGVQTCALPIFALAIGGNSPDLLALPHNATSSPTCGRASRSGLFPPIARASTPAARPRPERIPVLGARRSLHFRTEPAPLQTGRASCRETAPPT